MTFTTIPVDIVGPTYENQSLPFSAQVTRNLYHELNPTGRTTAALQSFPGAKAWLSGTAGEHDRGFHVMAGTLYKVSGKTLYKITDKPEQFDKGTILGSGRCIMADDGTRLVICTGAHRYEYNSSTDTLTNITSSTNFQAGDSVAHVNTQFIYDGTSANFFTSNPGTASTVTATDLGSAQSVGDDLMRVYAFNELIYLFGTSSIELLWNSGSGSPPFDFIQNSTMFIGLGALHSAANTQNWLYFLGNDHNVWRINNNQKQKVSSIAIANFLESVLDISNAKADTFTWNNQQFYALTVNNKTLVFCEDNEQWFELTYKAAQDEYLGNSFANVYGKLLLADKTDGNVFQLDKDTFTNNSNTIIRERITKPVDAIALGKPGQRLLLNRFEVVMETGTATATGDGADPQMMFQVSIDGGKSWRNEVWRNLGRTGETKKIEYYQSISGYSFQFRIKVSDPIKVSIHSAACDIKAAGW